MVAVTVTRRGGIVLPLELASQVGAFIGTPGGSPTTI